MLFDYFGTLTTAVRRGPEHRRMARRLGCDPDAWLALLDRTFYLRAAGHLGEPIDVLRMLATALGGDPAPEDVHAVFRARLRTVGTDGPLRPEAVPVLTALRARGLRTAVVSDCWYELPRYLAGLPVFPLLDAQVYSVREGRCKPDPGMYLAAAARIGVVPEECLYIGDGGSHELTGATRVGMHAVRLAAPDLVGHLSFGTDTGWEGPSMPSLAGVLDLLDEELALVR